MHERGGQDRKGGAPKEKEFKGGEFDMQATFFQTSMISGGKQEDINATGGNSTRTTRRDVTKERRRDEDAVNKPREKK